MNIRNITAKNVTLAGAAAALYIAATLGLAPVSYGGFQFRISEVLNLLAFYNPIYGVGIILGCFISNFYSPFGLIDVVFGTLHSCLSVFFITRSKHLFVASLWPVIFSFVIAIGIAIAEHLSFVPFVLIVLSVMLCEFVVVTLVGFPLFVMAAKNKAIAALLRNTEK